MLPNILVVNDDGIMSPWLSLLAEKLKKYGNVIICAPKEGRSAYSHAITILDYRKEDLEAIDVNVFTHNGTPADCVRYIDDFLNIDIDYVFSGINIGLNVGIDICYSGTCSAALEGLYRGYKSCAISSAIGFECCTQYLEEVLAYVFKHKLLSKKYALNINFPKEKNKTNKLFVVTHQAVPHPKKSCLSDVEAINQGYITMTPLSLDKTDYESLNSLK